MKAAEVPWGNATDSPIGEWFSVRARSSRNVQASPAIKSRKAIRSGQLLAICLQRSYNIVSEVARSYVVEQADMIWKDSSKSLAAMLFLLALIVGCASPHHLDRGSNRPSNFETDTFAF